jgi:hypothetical protein
VAFYGFKSGIFAAYSAHGVITVFSHHETKAVIDGEYYPGIFYINAQEIHFPEMKQITKIRQKFIIGITDIPASS